MNIEDIRLRFRYLIDTREKFLGTFRKIGWDEFAKDRGATWGSMLGVFLHILDNEEGWLQYGARRGTVEGSPDRKTGDYHDFPQLEKDNSNVGGLTESYLSTLEDSDLDRDVVLHLADGAYRRKVSKILGHAANDELAHMGELVCLLWQMDEAPFIDWLDYRV